MSTRTRNMYIVVALIVIVLAIGLATVGRSLFSQSNSVDYPSVSSAPLPSAAPFSPVPLLTPVVLYYGEGNCAPRFANGMRGTCINNQPCNGFGMKDANGSLSCACYEVKGGCPNGFICSAIERRCVPEGDEDR
jgi:hypothetical protein